MKYVLIVIQVKNLRIVIVIRNTDSQQSIDEPLNEDVPDKLIIRYLLKEIKKLKVELGKNESYISELEESLSKEKLKSANIRLLSDTAKKEIKKEQRYENMKVQIKNLEKSRKNLIILRDNLCFQVNKYREILIKNDLL